MPAADPIKAILKENDLRLKAINAPFNPVTGEGSIGQRRVYNIPDFPIPTQYLPVEMMDEPFVKKLKKAGTVERFIQDYLHLPYTQECVDKTVEQFVRIRNKYDPAFWFATLAYIKRKGGGRDCLFRINRPQRKLLARLVKMFFDGVPIRIILLKARQWGGSTLIQLFYAWIQLNREVGLNSLIIAHISSASDKIKAMYQKMINAYPVYMLHEMGDEYQLNEKKIVGVGQSGVIHRVPARNCDIIIGTAKSTENSRGGDYNLVHLSEVAFWTETDNTKPEDVVRSARVLYKPNTAFIEESTPNGVGNFFHKEYVDAKEGNSNFEAFFVAWFEIDLYTLDFASKEEREEFARWLYDNRESGEVKSNREEPGKYLWYLWNLGATLEAIHWYIEERKGFTEHGDMASEFPSDDIEAFTFSGRKVFDNVDVEQFRAGCRAPRWVGEVYGSADEGAQAFDNLRFKVEESGQLNMWADVEKDGDDEYVENRYLVVVDVCKGHTNNADYADILVLDRLFLMDGDNPTVVAEWHGHIDMDKLAWKAAQIAEYYNHALLVIESNTLETNNTKGDAEYILTLIGDLYDNLYTRKQSAEDIREGRPRKYGFHTNVNTKPVLINNLKLVVRDHLYIEREADCLNEYLTYVKTDNGKYEAPSGYHDDRLMTRAIGLFVSMNEMELPRIVQRNRHAALTTKETVSAATLL